MVQELNSHQRQFLKGLAHSLQPVVQLGGDGVKAGVLAAIDQALNDHELIKIKVAKSYTGDRGELAASVAEQSNAQLCQVIGRVMVLYREQSNTKKRQIHLP